MFHNFKQDLRWSLRPSNISGDVTVFLTHLPDGFSPDAIVSIEKADEDLDISGVDYICLTTVNTTVGFDAKRRRKGAANYWHGEADIAIEIWSDYDHQVPGWARKHSDRPDFFVFSFSDSAGLGYVFPAQELRSATRQHWKEWYTRYPHYVQPNGPWRSEVLFVPVSVLQAAMDDA